MNVMPTAETLSLISMLFRFAMWSKTMSSVEVLTLLNIPNLMCVISIWQNLVQVQVELSPLVRLLSSNVPHWKSILHEQEKRMCLPITPACVVFVVRLEVIQSIARDITGLPVQLYFSLGLLLLLLLFVELGSKDTRGLKAKKKNTKTYWNEQRSGASLKWTRSSATAEKQRVSCAYMRSWRAVSLR